MNNIDNVKTAIEYFALLLNRFKVNSDYGPFFSDWQMFLLNKNKR